MVKITEEQEKIINFQGNCIVKAFAGTGKTTTLLEKSKRLSGKALYLAFNRSVVEEAKQKFPKHVTPLTVHALARRSLHNNPKYERFVRSISSDGRSLNYFKLSEILGVSEPFAHLVVEVFKEFCHSDKDFHEFKKSSELLIYNEDIRKFLLWFTDGNMRKAYEILKEATDKIDKVWELFFNGTFQMTHDVYLKLFQLSMDDFPYLFESYDYVLLDEAQDTNPVTLSIFNRFKSQKIVVGDEHQKIYGFRKAIDGLKEFKFEELYLTTSFRFGSNISRKASEILRKYKGEYREIYGAGPKAPDNKTAFLTRTNSKLMQLIDMFDDFKLSRKPDDIFREAINIYNFLANAQKVGIYKYMETIEDIERYIELTNDKEVKMALEVYRKYGERIFDLKNKAQKRNNSNSNVVLSTIHSAKGLEWDNVVICDDVDDPENVIREFISSRRKNLGRQDVISLWLNEYLPKKDKDYEVASIAEEINLYYVAVTRAKRNLYLETYNPAV